MVKVREAHEEDLNFILNSWLKSYRNSYLAKYCPNDIYFTEQKKIIARVLDRSDVMALCVKEDNFQLVGYIVYERRPRDVVIHYCYVKSPFRRLGFARQLIDAVRKIYPLKTDFVVPISTQMSVKLQPKFKYIINPYVYGSIG